jgi:soluble lytic murein transglycosylase-like protein
MRRFGPRLQGWLRRFWRFLRPYRGRIARWALIVATPLCLLNVTVSICGHAAVFPLSPFFLGAKLKALGYYALHRPRCVFSEHPPLAPLIASAEARHRLPHGLLAAVITVETDSHVHRISPTGAMGPGQLMPSTVRALGVGDPFDPEENLDGSARYLAAQLHTFHDVRLAVAAYNAGPGAIVHRAVPQNGQTEYYVQRVMHIYHASRRRVAQRSP